MTFGLCSLDDQALRVVPPSETELCCQFCGFSSLGSPFDINGVVTVDAGFFFFIFVFLVTRIFRLGFALSQIHATILSKPNHLWLSIVLSVPITNRFNLMTSFFWFMLQLNYLYFLRRECSPISSMAIYEKVTSRFENWRVRHCTLVASGDNLIDSFVCFTILLYG